MTPTTALRVLAIPLGIAILALQIWIGLDSLGGWDNAKAVDVASMTLVFVALAVAPTIAILAFKTAHPIAGATVLAAFLAWIGYSIPTTLGRTSEVAETKVQSAEKANDKAAKTDALIADALIMANARLKVAQDQHDAAQQAAQKRCKRSPDSDACTKLTRREQQAKTYEADMQSRVDTLASRSAEFPEDVHVPDAGSATISWALSAWVAVAPESIRHSKSMAFAIGLDLFLWCLVHLGFSPRRESKSQPAEEENPPGQKDLPADDLVESEADYSKVTVLHPVVRALKDHGGEVVSNKKLAELMACCEGESSKRTGEVQALGLIEKTQVGKEVRIRLKAAG